MLNVNSKDIVSRLKEFLPQNHSSIPLHQPCFSGNEWHYVKDCLDTGWVSSVGEYVQRFEQALTQYTGAQYAIAVVNGTAALHTCLMLAEVNVDDEVLMPALTFVATANAVAYCRAIPHFVDIAPNTLGVDPDKLRDYLRHCAELRDKQCYNRYTGRRIPALVVMHAFGHPVDLDALGNVCDEYHITLIEDAAESLGSRYKQRHTGTIGRLNAVSFNGNKIITTGGGGAILTNDAELSQRARHLTTTAKSPHAWEYVHDRVGYNYRLPNINAAMGLGQLEQITTFVARKRALAKRYQQAFEDVDGITIFSEPEFACSNYWLNLLILDRPDVSLRNELLQTTHTAGILTRPAWELMHKLPMYSSCPHMDLSEAESYFNRIICLPSSVELAQ